MNIFLITEITKDISKFEIFGIIVGHIIFAIALTQLLDWSWLRNLMSKEDKEKMLKSYIWKDLVVDASIIMVIVGILFLIVSFLL